MLAPPKYYTQSIDISTYYFFTQVDNSLKNQLIRDYKQENGPIVSSIGKVSAQGQIVSNTKTDVHEFADREIAPPPPNFEILRLHLRAER